MREASAALFGRWFQATPLGLKIICPVTQGSSATLGYPREPVPGSTPEEKNPMCPAAAKPPLFPGAVPDRASGLTPKIPRPPYENKLRYP